MKTVHRGFTLLELMIGIIIVAILAGVAMPSFSKAIEKTKVKDAETVLSAISSAEKIYRLDDQNQQYGTLTTLIASNYIAAPDPGNNNADWDFDATSGAAFTATATRTGGGGYDGKKIVIDQNFNGTNYNGAGSNHPLRDQ